MIDLEDYFRDSIARGYVPTDQDNDRADDLLTRVNGIYEALGLPCELRSGHRTREKTLELRAKGLRAAIGGKHESSQAVDVTDPEDYADREISDELLAAYGLYRERPSATSSWVHLQNIPPGSGHRTFDP